MTVAPEDPALPWAEEPAGKSTGRAGLWVGVVVAVLVLGGLAGVALFLNQGPATPEEVVEELAASDSPEDMKAFTCAEIVEDAVAFVKYSTAVSLMITDAEDKGSLELESAQNADGTVVVSFTGAFTVTEWLVEEQEGDWKVCAWHVEPLSE